MTNLVNKKMTQAIHKNLIKAGYTLSCGNENILEYAFYHAGVTIKMLYIDLNEKNKIINVREWKAS